MKKYSLIKVGGFRIGDFKSINAGKKVFKNQIEFGLYQIIDNNSGIAIWEKSLKIKQVVGYSTNRY